MTSPILLTGGTGTLGRLVLPLLRDTGHAVRVLSRRPHEPSDGVQYFTGDLLRGVGLGPAVDGAHTVVHLAGGPRGDDEATRQLVRAAVRGGVRHLVFISIIATDRVPIGFYRAKQRAERAVAESGIPWTMLRAAQFHDLILTFVRTLTRLPVVPIPSDLRFQPVDARDVASRLVELASAEPAGLVQDLAGPQVYGFDELCRNYLQASGKRRPTIPVRLLGAIGRAYRAGDNLNLAATKGTRTWESFLAERGI